ncbi:MAG: hypothetical protein ACLSFR_09475 [Alphaproteobacteria bacterium]|mgnify:CR=1 FL=1
MILVTLIFATITILSLFLIRIPFLVIIFWGCLLILKTSYFIVAFIVSSLYILYISRASRKYLLSVLTLTNVEKEIIDKYSYYICNSISAPRMASLCAFIQLSSFILASWFYLQHNYLALGIVLSIGLYFTLTKLRVKLSPLECFFDMLVGAISLENKNPNSYAENHIINLTEQCNLLLNVLTKYADFQINNIEENLKLNIIRKEARDRMVRLITCSNEAHIQDFNDIIKMYTTDDSFIKRYNNLHK